MTTTLDNSGPGPPQHSHDSNTFDISRSQLIDFSLFTRTHLINVPHLCDTPAKIRHVATLSMANKNKSLICRVFCVIPVAQSLRCSCAERRVNQKYYQGGSCMRLKLMVLAVFTGLISISVADARPFRPGMIPNGFPAAGGCLACHTGFPRPGDGPRNAFGQEVGKRVTPGGQEVFWGPELAALDSDGDGFTNGEELGDPDGIWEQGTASVGHAALVSRPGSASSVPPPPKSVAVLNITVDPAEEGLEVSFSRSISGRVLDFSSSSSTSSEGTASATLRAANDFKSQRRGASGYYSAQVSNADGDILDRWSSIPIRGGSIVDLSLSVGGSASITGSAPLVPAASAAKIASGVALPVLDLASNVASGLAIHDRSIAAPEAYTLFQNSPNPFNPATQIRYQLPESAPVRLTVFNSLGQEVARLVNTPQNAGAYTVSWDAADFSSGLYYYQLEAGEYKDVRKMLLIK